MKDDIIMFDDQRAAHPCLQQGWHSRDGYLYADERTARYAGCTHRPCEECGATPSQAHHDDYHNPLDVHWLCRKHHMEFHRQLQVDFHSLQDQYSALYAKLEAVCEERDAERERSDRWEWVAHALTKGDDLFVNASRRYLVHLLGVYDVARATQPHPEEDGR